MKPRTNILFCLAAFCGLPFLIAGCADSVVEDSTTEKAAPKEVASPPTAYTDAEKELPAEKLVVAEDGTVTHAEITFGEAMSADSGLVLVDFWAPWCPPCRALSPELEKMAANHPDGITVVKVNADDAPALLEKFEVTGIPDMRVMKNGQEVAKANERDAESLAAEIGL